MRQNLKLCSSGHQRPKTGYHLQPQLALFTLIMRNTSPCVMIGYTSPWAWKKKKGFCRATAQTWHSSGRLASGSDFTLTVGWTVEIPPLSRLKQTAVAATAAICRKGRALQPSGALWGGPHRSGVFDNSNTWRTLSWVSNGLTTPSGVMMITTTTWTTCHSDMFTSFTRS